MFCFAAASAYVAFLTLPSRQSLATAEVKQPGKTLESRGRPFNRDCFFLPFSCYETRFINILFLPMHIGSKFLEPLYNMFFNSSQCLHVNTNILKEAWRIGVFKTVERMKKKNPSACNDALERLKQSRHILQYNAKVVACLFLSPCLPVCCWLLASRPTTARQTESAQHLQ